VSRVVLFGVGELSNEDRGFTAVGIAIVCCHACEVFLQLFCVSRAGSFQVIVLYVFSAQLGDNCARKGEADVVVDLVVSVLQRSFSKYWDYLGWLAALIITSAFPGKNSLRYDIFGALGGGLLPCRSASVGIRDTL
jgi:hypothetical protein